MKRKVIFLDQVKQYIQQGDYIVSVELWNGQIYDLKDVRIVRMLGQIVMNRPSKIAGILEPAERIIPTNWDKN